jgi:hypothetical protein
MLGSNLTFARTQKEPNQPEMRIARHVADADIPILRQAQATMPSSSELTHLLMARQKNPFDPCESPFDFSKRPLELL